MTFGHRFNWASLVAIAVIGAGARHWFNLRSRGQANSWILPVAAVGIFGLAVVGSLESITVDVDVEHAQIEYSRVQSIIEKRCVVCHAADPAHELFAAPPKNVILETPQQIQAQATAIDAQAVRSHIMPMGNLTQMTTEERAIVGQWIAQGARIDQ